MGVNSGIIKNIDCAKLRKALFATMPATLILSEGEENAGQRDVKRAEILQNAL